jgi:signal-transduction protein with cAMP-binding, CBS, and nucleotidyltransferase domain
MEDLIERFMRIYALRQPELSIFVSCWKPVVYNKGTHLLNEGKVSDYLYFVHKGAVRIYYLKDEKEITEWLTLDNNFFFSIQSFFNRTPSGSCD